MATEKTFDKEKEKSKHEILPAFRFTMVVEGGEEIALKSVRPFSKENEFEYIEEGGLNDYVHIKRKHASKPHQIQVERYLTQNFYDPIPNGGADFVLPVIIFVGGNNSENFFWNAERTYVFFGATVMNKEIGGFDAEKGGLLTETVTIAYHQLYYIDTPGDHTVDTWPFDGKIDNMYANQGWMSKINNDKTNDQLVTASNKLTWHFGATADDYLGNGVRVYEKDNVASKVPQGKTRKAAETSARANTWHFGKDALEYEGNGVRVYEDDMVVSKVPQGKTLEEAERKAKLNTWKFGRSADDYLG
ncbi:MAG: hypothetical protein J6N76_03770, partial [Lachnospiraceae bacterium]|nr:hypothetical protein [Lachnospiraceae bacterium]